MGNMLRDLNIRRRPLCVAPDAGRPAVTVPSDAVQSRSQNRVSTKRCLVCRKGALHLRTRLFPLRPFLWVICRSRSRLNVNGTRQKRSLHAGFHAHSIAGVPIWSRQTKNLPYGETGRTRGGKSLVENHCGRHEDQCPCMLFNVTKKDSLDVNIPPRPA